MHPDRLGYKPARAVTDEPTKLHINSKNKNFHTTGRAMCAVPTRNMQDALYSDHPL